MRARKKGRRGGVPPLATIFARRVAGALKCSTVEAVDPRELDDIVAHVARNIRSLKAVAAPSPGLDLAALFQAQVGGLLECHFLVLLWAAQAEDRRARYNITNCFDDLKHHRITRTKQSAVSIVEDLAALCFVSLRDEGNRRNIYISPCGAKALEQLVLQQKFSPLPSAFLEAAEA